MGSKVSKTICMIMFNRTFSKGTQYRVLKKLWSIMIIIISIWEVLLPAEHLHTCHLILTTLSPGIRTCLRRLRRSNAVLSPNHATAKEGRQDF